MQRTARLLAVLALFVMGSMPAAAQTRVDALPATAAYTKARFELVLTVFGEPVVVGRGAIDTADRLHVAIQSVATFDTPAETVEAVIYDGVLYTRRDGDTQWYTGDTLASLLPDTALPLLASRPSSAITLIGPVDLAGIPTNHYQLWYSFSDNSVITRDHFIGQVTPYLYKTQINGFNAPDDSVAIISYAYRYYDFEAEDIVVFRPEGALPRPASSAVASALTGQAQQSLLQLQAALRWPTR